MATTSRAIPMASSVAWRALRARQWAHFTLLPAAALLERAAAHDPLGDAWRVARGAMVAALALGYAYGLNAITDRATDRDPRKNPLAPVGDCPPQVIAMVLGAGVIALALAAAGGRLALAATAVSLLAATLYSVGPQLKAIPVVGTSMNGAIFAPLLVVAPQASVSPGLGLLVAIFLTLLFQNQLLHENADVGEDAAAGVVTTGLVLGERRVRWVVLALALVGGGAALALAPSRATAILAWLALAAATAIATRALPAARRRALHRRLALLGGGALFLGLLAW